MICLPFTICTILIGYLKDDFAMSSFGLCITLINAFFNGFFFGFQEIFGSYASRGFGSGNYKMMAKSLYQVCIILILIFRLF